MLAVEERIDLVLIDIFLTLLKDVVFPLLKRCQRLLIVVDRADKA